MRTTLCLLLLLALPALVMAQNTQQPTQFSNSVQWPAQAVPTSSTCVVGPQSTCATVTSSTPYVCEADFNANAVTVTVKDGQSSSISWINSSVTGTWIFTAPSDSTCRGFPNGVYIIAGGSGATGHMVIKY